MDDQIKHPWIVPHWPAPKSVQAFTTTRLGGVSLGPYESFNLADHVGDNPDDVLKNRQRLKTLAKLPADPLWLKQVHGTHVIHVEDYSTTAPPPEADAAISRTPGKIAAVLTADCLPIVLCNLQGTEVAAIHAGWRGLASGVIETTLSALRSPPKELLAWLGPAIGPNAFEVGEDVKSAFTGPQDIKAFRKMDPNNKTGSNSSLGSNNPSSNNKIGAQWKADIYQLARFRLEACNISGIFGGDHCTFFEPEQFYSFRRSNSTGRMATIIYTIHSELL